MTLEERVARALHAADRAGTWDACANKALWLKWARVAVKAMKKHRARRRAPRG